MIFLWLFSTNTILYTWLSLRNNFVGLPWDCCWTSATHWAKFSLLFTGGAAGAVFGGCEDFLEVERPLEERLDGADIWVPSGSGGNSDHLGAVMLGGNGGKLPLGGRDVGGADGTTWGVWADCCKCSTKDFFSGCFVALGVEDGNSSTTVAGLSFNGRTSKASAGTLRNINNVKQYFIMTAIFAPMGLLFTAKVV